MPSLKRMRCSPLSHGTPPDNEYRSQTCRTMRCTTHAPAPRLSVQDYDTLDIYLVSRHFLVCLLPTNRHFNLTVCVESQSSKTNKNIQSNTSKVLFNFNWKWINKQEQLHNRSVRFKGNLWGTSAILVKICIAMPNNKMKMKVKISAYNLRNDAIRWPKKFYDSNFIAIERLITLTVISLTTCWWSD